VSVSKVILRIVSGVMLVIAVFFLSFALNHPEFGSVFYIGRWEIGASVWRAFYLVYAITTVFLFVLSFFVGRKERQTKK